MKPTGQPAAPRGALDPRIALGLLLLCLGLLLVSVEPASAAPAWVHAGEVAETPGEPGDSPLVVTDPSGNTTVFWIGQDPETINSVVKASTRRPGGAWTTEQVSPSGENAYGLRAVSDPTGNLIAAWVGGSGSGSAIETAAKPLDGAWVSLGNVTVENSVSQPALAVDPAGNATVVWAGGNGTDWIVHAATRPLHGTWQTGASLSPVINYPPGGTVAVDDAGDLTALWVRKAGSEFVVETATRPAGGSWQSPVDVASVANAQFIEAAIAADPAGDVTAAWTQVIAGKKVIQAKTRPAGGDWGSAFDLSGPEGASNPTVAADAAGDFTVLWSAVEGGSEVLQAATLPAGGDWQPAVDVSAPTPSIGVPAVTVNAAGDALAVWENGDASFHAFPYAAVRPAGGDWQAPVDVSVAGTWSTRSATGALDPQGNATVAWSAEGSGTTVVEAAGFDPAGPRLELTVPSSGAPEAELSFSVVGIDVWSGLGEVRWSFDDGTTASGPSVSHAFATAGTHTVTVEASDTLGNVSKTSRTLTIAGEPVVRKPGPGPGGKESPPAPGGPGAQGATAVAARLLKVKGRTARLSLSCPASGACGGLATLSGAKRKPLGRASFSLAAGQSATVKVKLNGRARALLRRLHGRALRAKLGGTGVQARAVVLKAARKKAHR